MGRVQVRRRQWLPGQPSSGRVSSQCTKQWHSPGCTRQVEALVSAQRGCCPWRQANSQPSRRAFPLMPGRTPSLRPHPFLQNEAEWSRLTIPTMPLIDSWPLAYLPSGSVLYAMGSLPTFKRYCRSTSPFLHSRETTEEDHTHTECQECQVRRCRSRQGGTRNVSAAAPAHACCLSLCGAVIPWRLLGLAWQTRQEPPSPRGFKRLQAWQLPAEFSSSSAITLPHTPAHP